MERRDFFKLGVAASILATEAVRCPAKTGLTSEEVGTALPAQPVVKDESVSLLDLNKRLCDLWPAFTGFKESYMNIDLVGQVWPGGKRFVGPYVNVTISGADDLFSMGGTGQSSLVKVGGDERVDLFELKRPDKPSAFWFAHEKIRCAVMNEILKDPHYVALPQDEWNKVWNGIQPAHRCFEKESPLGAKGYVSIFHPTHGVLVITAKNHPSLSPGLDDDVRNLGLNVSLELPTREDSNG